MLRKEVCVRVCVFSSRYFTALAKGEPLPVTDRLEMSVATQKTNTGLTPGLLKTLHKQVLPHEQTTPTPHGSHWMCSSRRCSCVDKFVK